MLNSDQPMQRWQFCVSEDDLACLDHICVHRHSAVVRLGKGNDPTRAGAFRLALLSAPSFEWSDSIKALIDSCREIAKAKSLRNDIPPFRKWTVFISEQHRECIESLVRLTGLEYEGEAARFAIRYLGTQTYFKPSDGEW